MNPASFASPLAKVRATEDHTDQGLAASGGSVAHRINHSFCATDLGQCVPRMPGIVSLGPYGIAVVRPSLRMRAERQATTPPGPEPHFRIESGHPNRRTAPSEGPA